jgi:hypothetical protein
VFFMCYRLTAFFFYGVKSSLVCVRVRVCDLRMSGFAHSQYGDAVMVNPVHFSRLLYTVCRLYGSSFEPCMDVCCSQYRVTFFPTESSVLIDFIHDERAHVCGRSKGERH